MILKPMQRVLVVGTSGSGKTTFAQRLAEKMDADHIELDSLHWLPGWQERPHEQFAELLQERLQGERWVVDGNYTRTRQLILSCATHLVWLNYPFVFVFWRVLVRTFSRAYTQEPLFSGNKELWRQSFFSRDSILLWVITSHNRRKRTYRQIFTEKAFQNLEYVEFTNHKQAERFIQSL